MLSVDSPASAYSVQRNPQKNSIEVLYDDKNIHDEETLYEFKDDGSATARSLAWGTTTTCPPGTFSDMLVSLPKTEELNSEIGKKLAVAYRNSATA